MPQRMSSGLRQRQGPGLEPIAVRAGVVDGSWLPRTARAIAHHVSQVTSREAEATGRELMRLPYSRSSIERVGHAVGAYAIGAAPFAYGARDETVSSSIESIDTAEAVADGVRSCASRVPGAVQSIVNPILVYRM